MVNKRIGKSCIGMSAITLSGDWIKRIFTHTLI